MGIRAWFSRAPQRPRAADATDETRQLAQKLVDMVRLQHPLAGDTIHLDLSSDGTRGRLDAVEVPGVSETAVLPELLTYDAALHTAHTSGLADAMLTSAGWPASRWTTMSIEIHGTTVTIGDLVIEVDPDALCFDARFMKALDELQDIVPPRQDALHRRMSAPGPAAPSWQREEKTLTFVPSSGEPLVLHAEVLGSFAPSHLTWCWAWANRDLARHADACASLRDGPLPILATPGCRGSEAFAFVLAYLAAEYLGRYPVWRWPLRSGVQLFFAITD